jgi:hypothetical protein
MSDDSTGSGIGSLANDRVSPSVIAGGTVSGDPHAPALVTSGTRATGAASQDAFRAARVPPGTPKVEPKVRQRCHALLSACLEDLDRAIDQEAEFFLRNNALEEVKYSLAKLWEVRSQREEQFAEVINLLQGLFVERDVEQFTHDQLACLRSAFERLRQESVYDDDFINAVTIDLLNGGLDVFRGIE